MNLVILPQALVELQEAAGFYRTRAGGQLALTFTAEIERSVALLQQQPLIGAVLARQYASACVAPLSVQPAVSGKA